jgi:hypothetical protein
MLILDPVAPAGKEQAHSRHALDDLKGKVVGFIDNAKPNFHHLVDDLAELLVRDYGVAGVVRHRKRGQVPAGDDVMAKLSGECDVVIAGSGD